MDTAQRGMGLDWPLALELIKRSTAAAKARGALVASGAGTDHLPPGKDLTLQDVTMPTWSSAKPLKPWVDGSS